MVDDRQHVADRADAGHHGLLRAAGLLDRHRAKRVGFLQPIRFLPARDLKSLAAEPDHDDAADIRVGRISPLRALEDFVALALDIERTAAAMHERNDAVDIWIV